MEKLGRMEQVRNWVDILMWETQHFVLIKYVRLPSTNSRDHAEVNGDPGGDALHFFIYYLPTLVFLQYGKTVILLGFFL